MQRQLLQEFYEESGIDPVDLSYVEAHGTGTKVGDPQEIQAIDTVLAKVRDKELLIGSVKSSIGHTEPASGVASVVKVLIAMETGVIAPNVNFKTHRKGIEAFECKRLKVVTEKTPLEGEQALVGVNSFGFGGNNCHAVIRRFGKRKHLDATQDNLPRLVCVSGRCKESVARFLNDLETRTFDPEFVALLQNSFRLNFPNHLYRGFSLVSKTGCLVKSIRRSLGKLTPLHIYFGDIENSFRSIGKCLLELPVFQETIYRINQILGLKKNVFDIILNGSHVLGPISVQIGLADVLKTLNIVPQALHGNTIICSYFKNEISLNETLKYSIETSTKGLQFDSVLEENFSEFGILCISTPNV